METTEGANTFLKVEEANEVGSQAGILDMPPQRLSGDESWLTDSEDPQELDAEEQKQNVSRTHIRPTLHKDQWAAAPQQLPPTASPSANENGEGDPTDSLSLMQLKRIVKDMPVKEPTPYDFHYKDMSKFEEELEELFGYSVEERRMLSRLPDAYNRSWEDFCGSDSVDEDSGLEGTAGWNDVSDSVRQKFLEKLRDGIATSDPLDRATYTQALLYLALGHWMDTARNGVDSSQPDVSVDKPGEDTASKRSSSQALRHAQMVEIEKNLQMIGEKVGVRPIFDALREALLRGRRRRSAESDYQGQEKSVAMDSDIDTWGLLVLMYLLVDRARRQQLGNSIGRLVIESRIVSTELLHFVSNMLANMRWEESGILPPVKVLSLYWKTVLLAFGGVEDVKRIKACFEEADNPGAAEDKPYITASPLDYHFFRQEITSKYPAFDPPQPLFPFEPEHSSFVPPLQEHLAKSTASNGQSTSGPFSINGTGSSIFHQPVHISTPAPSPPPSPAGPGGKGVKKQNYQTNQMFPFLYPPLEPTSNEIGGRGSTEVQDTLVGRMWAGSDIPASILEAADLFAKRMRATRAMKQLWEERVRFMKFERGYDSLANNDERAKKAEDEDLDGLEDRAKPTDNVESIAALDEKSRQSLRNVEGFYSRDVPQLQSIMIVLLKVLLQTVTTLVTQPNMPNGSQNGFQLPDEAAQSKPTTNGDSAEAQDKQPSSILQNLDIVRSQEIMCKAVSGILLLLLKWFKLSHVLKFEYLSQLLLDSNYVQLIMKLFTHQELDRVVNFKCERTSLNFFGLCQSQARGNDILDSDGEESHDSDDAVPPPIRPRRQANSDPTDDVPLSATRIKAPDADNPAAETSNAPITDYSWRNFFTNINHLRILQKIIKHKAHRQLMMVQYKYTNILKKSLKVTQPDTFLYTLKIIKGQVPYYHRKWRQSNMRTITQIYLNCKPELRDDWLAGLALEEEMSEALPLEQALRSLTYWHNLRRYPDVMGQNAEKARGLLEEEQDFFTRELDLMEATFGGLPEDRESVDGEEMMEAGQRAEVPVQMDAW